MSARIAVFVVEVSVPVTEEFSTTVAEIQSEIESGIQSQQVAYRIAVSKGGDMTLDLCEFLDDQE